MLIEEKVKSRLQITAWVALLYGLIAFKAGFEVATWLISSGIAGYLNSFIMLPSLISAAKGKRSRRLHIVFSVIALLASCFIIYFGYWILLALCTLSFLLMYCVIVVMTE